MSERWTVHKVPATVMISREQLGGDVTPFSRPTPEQRAQWAAERAERERRLAEYAAATDDIADPLARVVLDLHRREGDTRPVCIGCDADGFETEYPEWPCRTVRLVGQRFGLEDPR